MTNIAPVNGVMGVPVGSPVVAVQGNQIGMFRRARRAAGTRRPADTGSGRSGGIEGEVGYRLPFGNALGSDTETRMFLGGYAFWGDGYPTYAGPRGRLEFRLYDLPLLGDGSRLTAGGELLGQPSG